MALGNRKTRPNLISRLLCLMLITWTVAKTVYNWTHLEKETQNSVTTLHELAKPLVKQASLSLWCNKKVRPKQTSPYKKSHKSNKTCHLLLILLLSGDVELNPGPAHVNDSIYPCPCCELQVDYGMKALQCDHCSMWYHKTCISMCTRDYRNLENNSISYLCFRCNHPNYMTNSLTQEISTENTYDPLLHVPKDITSEKDIASFHPRVVQK